jgi:glycosyltransferase involved in cell wall biosynthesis
MNALTDNDQDIVSRILTEPIKQQPEIFMQVTVPNEFQRLGKFNIGVTAGIETNLCDHTWIEGCNRMDLILASSEHAKAVFEGTTYEKKDNQTGQIVGALKLEKPVEVLFEGIKLDSFKKGYTASPLIESTLKDVKEDFAFLFVGHWLPGSFTEDRKNVGGLVKTFLETFKNKTNAPALILKTSGGAISIVDREMIVSKINQIRGAVEATKLPNIYIVYGDLTEAEMNDLYNHPKVMAHVSFTRGEGFGRPLLEAALTSKPIITSNWSGHLDFLNNESSILIDGEMTTVHPSAVWKGVINETAQWFTINYGQAAAYMKDVHKNYKAYTEKSRKTYHHIKTNFSFEAMQNKVDSILTARLPEFPKNIGLTLPKLKKVEEAPKIELPKLKKIEA